MLNTFLLSMKGTPYTYYGDELGMTNIDMPDIEEYVDVDAIGKYKAALDAGEDMDEFMRVLNYSSRENGRTPMQWDDTENAGFTTGVPWKKVNDNYKEINVQRQDKDPNSILNHFRKMTQIRKEHPVLIYGDYEIVQKEHPSIYAFTRTLDENKILVLLNFSMEDATISALQTNDFSGILINNYNDLRVDKGSVHLRPYQAVLVKIDE